MGQGKNSNLTVISPRRQLLKIYYEANGNRLNGMIHIRRRFKSICLQYLGPISIKTDECDQRVNCFLCMPICLEIDVHGSGFAEDASHTRNQFLAIMHQRIDAISLGSGFIFARVVESFMHAEPLAAEHN